MSMTIAPPVVPLRETDTPVRTTKNWLVGPWFDLLFLANLLWPLMLFVPLREGFDGRAGVQFWQIYFITTPHRWLTLLLVFGDRQRFRERRGTFLGIALLVTAVCLSVQATTGALTCLLAVDYVWNAWHFSAQHHGIFRIYGRLNESAPVGGLAFEKWLLRCFLLYVILRVAGATWGNPQLQSALAFGDYFILALPVMLIGKLALRGATHSAGGTIYLLSTLALYSSLLWAVHAQRPALILTLATASALFHAIEYLAISGWSTQQRATRVGTKMGLLGWLVPRWGMMLGVYLLVLGSVGWLMDRHLLQTWLLLNVIVAFLHYSYDACIWRRPRGASGPTSSVVTVTEQP